MRFYVPFKGEKVSFAYSPFVGFSGRSAPSDEYQAAFARADVNPPYLDFPLGHPEQFLESGVELSFRWNFSRSFFVQGSALGMYKFSLLDDGESSPDFDLALAVGYIFYSCRLSETSDS